MTGSGKSTGQPTPNPPKSPLSEGDAVFIERGSAKRYEKLRWKRSSSLAASTWIWLLKYPNCHNEAKRSRDSSFRCCLVEKGPIKLLPLGDLAAP